MHMHAQAHNKTTNIKFAYKFYSEIYNWRKGSQNVIEEAIIIYQRKMHKYKKYGVIGG